MSETNKALVCGFVEAINAQDWPLLRDLVVDAFARHSTAGGEPGIKSREDLRIEGGRIAEAWAEWDNLAGLRQLGHQGAT